MHQVRGRDYVYKRIWLLSEREPDLWNIWYQRYLINCKQVSTHHNTILVFLLVLQVSSNNSTTVSCFTCPVWQQPDSGRAACIPCQDMCRCPSDYEDVNGTCVRTTDVVPDSSTLYTLNHQGRLYVSSFLRNWVRPIASKCKVLDSLWPEINIKYIQSHILFSPSVMEGRASIWPISAPLLTIILIRNRLAPSTDSFPIVSVFHLYITMKEATITFLNLNASIYAKIKYDIIMLIMPNIKYNKFYIWMVYRGSSLWWNSTHSMVHTCLWNHFNPSSLQCAAPILGVKCREMPILERRARYRTRASTMAICTFMNSFSSINLVWSTFL